MRSHFYRNLRALLRDTRVLLQESRVSLLLFWGLVLGGAILFYLFYVSPETQARLSFSEALHATFALVFFEVSVPYPKDWYLQPLFFIIPIFGLGVLADGVLRFGNALFNKQTRGQKWQVAMASTYSNHIIICGLGKVGYRTAVELLKFDRDVVGIESDENGRFVENTKALGIPVIIADARRQEHLFKAGVEKADAIIPCTDDELTNLDIALDAREVNPSIKVVLRMFDPDLARRVEKGFGIHTALSTSALAAPIFAAAAMRVDTKHSFYVGDTLLNLTEIVVEPSSQILNWTVEKLEATLDLSVVFLQCGGVDSIHPAPTAQLRAGDTMLVLASIKVLQRLNELNQAR